MKDTFFNKWVIILSLGTFLSTSLFADKLVVNASNLQIRSNPSIKAKVLGKLQKEDIVTELEKQEDIVKISGRTSNWVKIKTNSGLIGWVFGAYLKPYEYKGRNYFSFSDARDCCYKICQKNCTGAECDCGEGCEGGGYDAIIPYGWTPTKEELQNLKTYYGPDYDPKSFKQSPIPEQCR